MKVRCGVLKPQKNHSFPTGPYIPHAGKIWLLGGLFDSVVYLNIYPKPSNQTTNPRNEVPHSNAKGTA